ncbi:MAG: hypothetical protein ACP5G1_01055 [Nanopusillaceae archaeon]
MSDWEKLYETSVRTKTRFLLQDFYEKFAKLLKSKNWEGIFKKDRFEKYYFHKLSAIDNSLYIEAQWELYKNFWKEEPKIDWKLEIGIVVNGYNINTLIGDISVSIKSFHKVEEFKDFDVKKAKKSEKILLFLGFSKVLSNLKKNLEKTTGKSKLTELSGRDLYNESEEIRKWIIEYFKLYNY